MATISACAYALDAGMQAEKEGKYLLAARYFRLCDNMFEMGSDWNVETFYAHRDIQEKAQEHWYYCKSKLSEKQQRWLTAERYNENMRGGVDIIAHDDNEINKLLKWEQEHKKQNGDTTQKTKTEGTVDQKQIEEKTENYTNTHPQPSFFRRIITKLFPFIK